MQDPISPVFLLMKSRNRNRLTKPTIAEETPHNKVYCSMNNEEVYGTPLKDRTLEERVTGPLQYLPFRNGAYEYEGLVDSGAQLNILCEAVAKRLHSKPMYHVNTIINGIGKIGQVATRWVRVAMVISNRTVSAVFAVVKYSPYLVLTVRFAITILGLEPTW